MRWTRCKKPNPHDPWTLWFAWYPVRITHSSDSLCRTWVWLEDVVYRTDYFWDMCITDYKEVPR